MSRSLDAVRRRRWTLTLGIVLAVAACTGGEDPAPSTSPGDTAAGTTEALPTEVADLPGRLVIVDDDGNVVLIDPDGSNPVPITDDAGDAAGYRQPSFSPVSGTVVFSEINAEGSGLGWSDEEGVRSSVPMSGPPFFIFWSPDGNGIGVLHNSATGTIDFELVDVGDVSAEVVAQGSPFYFSWSPDSSQVAAHVQGDLLGTIDLAGEGSDLGATAAGYQAPHWVPGGILHLADEGLELRQPGGEGRIVATVPGPVSFVANRQGTKVAIQSFVDDEGAPPGVDVAISETPAIPGNEVVVIDLESGEMSRVVDTLAIGLFWAPDGESLLVLDPSVGAPEVAVHVWRGGDATEVSRIAPHPSLIADVLRFFDQYGQSLQLWSPDSAAFALPGAIDDEPGIWVHLVGGGDPVNVADGSWVAWSGV
jgi:hypothetical protein